MVSNTEYEQVYKKTAEYVKEDLKTYGRKTLLEIINNLYPKYESLIIGDHFDPVLLAQFVKRALNELYKKNLVKKYKTSESRNDMYEINWYEIIKEYVEKIFEEYKTRELTTASIYLYILKNNNVRFIIDDKAFLIDCVGIALENLEHSRRIKKISTNILDDLSTSTYQKL